MVTKKSVLGILLLAASACASAAGEISIGSPAPKLDIKTWVKGTPVNGFEAGKTYVVEFWATWCGPCKTSIPHLTELAKKNSDITFIGVSIWEDNDDQRVEKFVTEMGAKMDYTVAYSGNKTGMSESWMTAAGQNGIPSAFIVKDRTIVWIGHPMSMDKPLEEIKAGTYDMAKAKTKMDEAVAANRRAMEINKELGAIKKQFAAGQKAEAKAKLADLVKKYPEAEANAKPMQLAWIAEENPAEFSKKAKGMARKEDDRDQLLSFAMANASPTSKLIPQVREAVQLSLAATKEKEMKTLWYALTIFERIGDKAAALKAAQTALDVFPTSDMKDEADFKKFLETTVDRLKKA
ncbi:MAG: redoxin family protein [Chthonomonas sp.]|nr:redoxin family protein [Chthonomonas sp.]